MAAPRTAAAAVVALVATACGSTAQIGPSQAGDEHAAVAAPGDAGDPSAGDGLSLDLNEVPTGPVGDGATGSQSAGSSGPSVSAPSGEPTAGSTGAAEPGQPRPSRPAAGGSAPADVQGPALGVTDTEVHVGFSIRENQESMNQAAGFNTGQSDQRAVLEAVVEDINSRGGVAGRLLVPVIHVFDATSNESSAAQEQGACATWTQDNEVFAVVMDARSSDTLRGCLQDAGVEMLGKSLSGSDDRTFAEFSYAEVSNPSLTRVASTTVHGLHGLGYYEPEGVTGPLVGLVRLDYPTHERAAAVIREALGRHGLELTEDVAIRVPGSNAELGSFVAEIQNAVLRFKTLGIDHVHILNSDVTLFFMTSAEGQDYRPQYGFSTSNGNQILTTVVPAAQFRNAMSVGWWPIVDVREVDDPGLSHTADRCLEVMRENGLEASDRNALGQQLAICDSVNALAAALDPAHGPMAPGRLLSGLDRLGQSFVSTTTFATDLGPDRHDGAALWRGLQFHDDCTCFKYTTPAQAFVRQS